MPNAWVHATIDLLSFGRPYLHIHQDKDNASKILGSKHRIVNHAWYQEYGNRWNFTDPFPAWLLESIEDLLHRESPDQVEEQMVSIAHDHLDRVWDDLLYSERKYCEEFFTWVLLRPSILKSWAGVDVLNGRIQRIVDGREIWEYCPDLKFKYRMLRRYVEAVISNNKSLQSMIRRYG